MANYTESRLAECCGKFFNVRPTVEAHAETVVLQDAVEFGEGQLEPGEIVVGDCPPTVVPMAPDVGGIGQHEVNAVRGKLGQDVGAVAVDNGIGLKCVHKNPLECELRLMERPGRPKPPR